MNSAAEARFRLQAPNQATRRTAVIALDAPAEAVVRRLAAAGRTGATFLIAAQGEAGEPGDPPATSPRPAVSDLDGHGRSVTDEVDAADLVVLVAGPGGRAQSASLIGQACSHKRVMTTGCIVGAGSAPESAVSKTLAQVRPWSLMVVIAPGDAYIDDLISALRA